MWWGYVWIVRCLNWQKKCSFYFWHWGHFWESRWVTHRGGLTSSRTEITILAVHSATLRITQIEQGSEVPRVLFKVLFLAEEGVYCLTSSRTEITIVAETFCRHIKNYAKYIPQKDVAPVLKEGFGYVPCKCNTYLSSFALVWDTKLQLILTFQSHRMTCFATSIRIKDASKRRWWRERSLLWGDIGMQVRHGGRGILGMSGLGKTRTSWAAATAQQEGGGGRFRTSRGASLSDYWEPPAFSVFPPRSCFLCLLHQATTYFSPPTSVLPYVTQLWNQWKKLTGSPVHFKGHLCKGHKWDFWHPPAVNCDCRKSRLAGA